MSRKIFSILLAVPFLLFSLSLPSFAQNAQNQNQGQNGFGSAGQPESEIEEATSVEIDPATLRQPQQINQQAQNRIQDRQARLESLQSERNTRVMEIQQTRQQNREERMMALQTRFGEGQGQSAEKIIARSELTAARLNKAVAHLYSVLVRLQEYIDAREESGFSVGDYSAELDVAEQSIKSVESKINTFENNASAVADAQTPEEVRTILSDLKTESQSIKTELRNVKTEVQSIILQIRTGQ